MCADANELVYDGESAQDGPVPHMDMARKLGVVRKDRVAAYLAIVRQMDVSHDPVVVPDGGHSTILHGADVHGAELADGVAIAKNQLARFAAVLFVLGNAAERCVPEDAVVLPDRRVAFDDAVRANSGVGANADVRPDEGVGADGYRAVEFGAWVDEGRGVDGAQGGKGSAEKGQAGWCQWGRPGFRRFCAWRRSARLRRPIPRPQ